MVSIDTKGVNPKKKHKKTWLIIAIVVLIFVAILALVVIPNNFFLDKAKTLSFKRTPTISPGIHEDKLLSVSKKAEKAGYSVYWEVTWNNEKNDSSGRYMLASPKRVVDGWTDAFGWQENMSDANKDTRVTGVFLSIKPIKGTKDLQITIRDMSKGEETKARLVYELSSGFNKTFIRVANLDYGPLNQIKPIDEIGYLDDLNLNRLDKILKQGDIVSIYVEKELENGKHQLKKDSENLPIASIVELRRFGGASSINDELR